MRNPIETIRLSERARNQLIRMKAKTGLEHWNELCRWAFCLSLAEPSVPSEIEENPSPTTKQKKQAGAKKSTVEMTWKTFGGEYEDIYFTLLKQRCHRDNLGTSDEVLVRQFRLHLHRGIGYLSVHQYINDIQDLVNLISLEAEQQL